MKLSSLLCALVLFSEASYALPNGLCVLFGKPVGYGHGFLVGDLLISNAHVLNSSHGDWRCVQDDHLVSIKDRLIGQINVHPEFDNEQFDGHDLAFARLQPGLKTDFVLPEYADYGGALQYESSGELSPDHFLLAIGKDQVTLQRSRGLLLPVLDISNEEFDFFDPAVHLPSEVTSYWEYGIRPRKGFSGAPVFNIDRRGGKLVVMGIETAIMSKIGLTPEEERDYLQKGAVTLDPALVTPVFHLNAWLWRTQACERRLQPSRLRKNSRTAAGTQ